MDKYELEALDAGYRGVAGVDEAGRGPLAGPVVAAAVIFEKPPLGLGIKDSKKLTHKKRTSLAKDIFSVASSVGVGVVCPPLIDEINIHRASLLAMKRAVESLASPPEFLLIDGKFPIDMTIPQLPIISGDSLSVSIAAASIIAKTTRDAWMTVYDRLYPGYNFAGNKGYPTKDHYAALKDFGPTPIHRRSFRGVLVQD
jgi:ribonuclease HII